MNKLMIIMILFAVSVSAQLIKMPGLFPFSKQFYEAREFVKNKNSYECKRSAVLLWRMIGEENGEIIVFRMWGISSKMHATVFVYRSRIYMDCKENSISRQLPLGATFVERFRKFKDIPENWEKD